MSNLMLRLDGERIILRQRMHWAFFILPGISGILLSVPFLLSYLILSKIFNTGDSHLPSLITFLSLAFSLVPAIIFLGTGIATYLRSRTVLTNERLAYSIGLLFRRSGEIALENFQEISVHQSLPGNCLDYGTITVNLNDGTALRFPYIPSPNEFRSEFQRAVEARQAILLRKSGTSQPAK